MRRFNRIFLFPAFPFLVLFWGIGWLLYWIGSQRIDKTKKLSNQNNIEMIALMPDQEQYIKKTSCESLEA